MQARARGSRHPDAIILPPMSEPGTQDRPLRVAIVGSGPAGFYTVQALVQTPGVPVAIDMFDRLPTPFGLVRARRRARPSEDQVGHAPSTTSWPSRPDFRFFGNVEFGRAITARRSARALRPDRLRHGRADRPRAGHPRRGLRGQPPRDRVRRLVQRPSRLLRPAASTSTASARSWSAWATWRSTSRASCAARPRSWPRPTSPITRSRRCAESRVREV